MQIDNAELDIVLVRQKDSILKAINNGNKAIARTMLNTVRELWIAAGYEYKIKEIEARLTEKSPAFAG